LDELRLKVLDKEREFRRLEEECAKHALTAEEKKIREKLDQARTALKSRKERLEELTRDKTRLEGKLENTEGLHAKRTAAEQELHENEIKRAALEREIKAHALLLKWFEEIKSTAVASAVKPVSEQVDLWLLELDGERRKKLLFGQSLNAEQIEVNENKLVDLDENSTSYGERELLSTIVRLAYGAMLAREEPQAVILDDPLAHSDSFYHQRMLAILEDAARKNLQLIILTCHPERFDHLRDAQMIDLKSMMTA